MSLRKESPLALLLCPVNNQPPISHLAVADLRISLCSPQKYRLNSGRICPAQLRARARNWDDNSLIFQQKQDLSPSKSERAVAIVLTTQNL